MASSERLVAKAGGVAQDFELLVGRQRPNRFQNGLFKRHGNPQRHYHLTELRLVF
jgi:hypothetical protein